jgi:flagellar protein FliS
MENVSSEYLRNAVMTASPEQLQLMLYDGAIRFARQGIEGVRNKDWESSFNGFSRAQKIIVEMNQSLNHDVDPHLCKRMSSLYTFIYQKLVEASLTRDLRTAEDILKLIEYQRETWVMLMEKLRTEQAVGTTTAEPTSRKTSPPATSARTASATRIKPAAPRTRDFVDGEHSTYGSLSVQG